MARGRESPAAARERRAAVEDPAIVLEAALRFLEPRGRAIAEVRRRLTQAGYRSDLVEGAIARLLDLGMLDDEAFARHWVESRERAHPRGAIALRRELRQKGIADEVVRAVLEAREAATINVDTDAPASADERAAEQLLARKAAVLARVADPRQRRQRAYAMLARAGFDPDVCRRVAAAASLPLEDAEEDAPGDG